MTELPRLRLGRFGWWECGLLSEDPIWWAYGPTPAMAFFNWLWCQQTPEVSKSEAAAPSAALPKENL